VAPARTKGSELATLHVQRTCPKPHPGSRLWLLLLLLLLFLLLLLLLLLLFLLVLFLLLLVFWLCCCCWFVVACSTIFQNAGSMLSFVSDLTQMKMTHQVC